MPFVPLSIPPGVIRPATALQAKGRYWDANLIRWRGNKLLPVGGWQRATETPLDSQARTIFPWASNAGNTYVAIGCDDDMYVSDNDGMNNVTPAGFIGTSAGQNGGYGASDYGTDYTDDDYGEPRTGPSALFAPIFSWTFDNWGEELLAVASSDGRLLHYSPGEAQADVVGVVDITTIQRAANVVTVTSSSAHGFQVGDEITIAGVTTSSFNGTFIITAVPSTVTFQYSQAGTDATSSGGTATHTLVPITNRAVAVTQERHAVLLGVGGNPRRVGWSSREDYTDWDFANVTNTAGFFDLDTQNNLVMLATVREGTLIWTDDEVWLMRYVGLPYIYNFDRIGYGCGLISARAFATAAGRCIWMGREGFWLYDGGYVKPLPCDVSSYVFDNLDTEAAALYTHGSENNIFPEVWFWWPETNSDVPNKYVAYSYAEGWWTIGDMTRTAACGAGVIQYPMMADENNDLFYHENGWTNSGTPLVGYRYAETGAINMQGGNNITLINQAMTDSGYGYNSTQLTFYGSYTPEGTETTFGPYNPRSDGYTDCRAQGRDFRVRIGATQDAEWSVGEMRINIIPRGGR
jgi:hypothetical protein